MNIRIHKIIPSSQVDGPGPRAVVFLQGCTLACPGCQNRKLWPAAGGREVVVAELAETLCLLAYRHGNVTISGGEPFQQPESLARLVRELRYRGARHVVVYTGYAWEELHSPSHPARAYLQEILERVDVLVDGRFVRELDDALITWRGSRNQRAIAVAESRLRGEVVTEDWDSPRVVIGPDGNMLMPIGLEHIFSESGKVERTRMCGQTRPE